VKLPRIGVVRTHESTRTLARHVERGTARIRSATVTHQGGGWFCSLSVEIERHDPAPARPDSVVGVDLGLKSLAALSTGEVIANPRHLEIAAGGPAPGPRQPHPVPALSAVAPHPGPHRDTPHPRSPTRTATACTIFPPPRRASAAAQAPDPKIGGEWAGKHLA
jgi:hypothetical protein